MGALIEWVKFHKPLIENQTDNLCAYVKDLPEEEFMQLEQSGEFRVLLKNLFSEFRELKENNRLVTEIQIDEE